MARAIGLVAAPWLSRDGGDHRRAHGGSPTASNRLGMGAALTLALGDGRQEPVTVA